MEELGQVDILFETFDNLRGGCLQEMRMSKKTAKKLTIPLSQGQLVKVGLLKKLVYTKMPTAQHV
jgi:hypothetical protein